MNFIAIQGIDEATVLVNVDKIVYIEPKSLVTNYGESIPDGSVIHFSSSVLYSLDSLERISYLIRRVRP